MPEFKGVLHVAKLGQHHVDELVDTGVFFYQAGDVGKERMRPVGAIQFGAAIRAGFQYARVFKPVELHPHRVGGLAELLREASQV